MATWAVHGDRLCLTLGTWERIGSLHGDVCVPLSSVVSVDEVDDPWHHLRGIRAPGTGIPFVIMLGTTRYQGRKDFCAVYGRSTATIVTLADCEFARLVATGPAPVLRENSSIWGTNTLP